MKKYLSLGLLLIVAACKEPSVEVEAPKAYNAMSTGDYRVYTVSDLDSNNHPTSTSKDSVVTREKTTHAGMEAFMTVSFINDTANAPQYVAAKDEALYAYYAPMAIPGFPAVDVSWVKEADFSSAATSWEVFDSTYQSFPLTGFPVDATAKGNVKQVRTKGKEVDVTLGNGTVVKALEITATTFVNMTVTPAQLPFPIPVVFENVEKNYYARGIGLVRSKRDSYRINVVTFSQVINGFDKVLQRYSVK